MERRYRKRLGRNPTSQDLLIDLLTTEGDMNLLERLTNTCLTEAAFSPNCLAGCIAVKKLQLQFLD